LNYPLDKKKNTFSYIFVNPHGEYLGYNCIPYKYFYGVFLGLWIVFLILWIINWAINRTQKFSIIHRIVTIYPILKIIWLTYAFGTWLGYSTYGTYPVAGSVIYYFIFIIQRVALYGVFLFISLGYGIVILKLGYNWMMWVSLLLALAAAMSFGLASAGLFELIVLVAYIIIMIVIFHNSRVTLFLLQKVRDDPSNGNLPRVENVNEKIRLLGIFRIVMIMYIAVMISIIVIAIFVFFYYSWITDMLSEVIEFIVFVIIAITFRLRKENIYHLFYETEVIPPTPRASVEQPFSKSNVTYVSDTVTPSGNDNHDFHDIPLDTDSNSSKDKNHNYSDL